MTLQNVFNLAYNLSMNGVTIEQRVQGNMSNVQGHFNTKNCVVTCMDIATLSRWSLCTRKFIINSNFSSMTDVCSNEMTFHCIKKQQ